MNKIVRKVSFRKAMFGALGDRLSHGGSETMIQSSELMSQFYPWIQEKINLVVSKILAW